MSGFPAYYPVERLGGAASGVVAGARLAFDLWRRSTNSRYHLDCLSTSSIAQANPLGFSFEQRSICTRIPYLIQEVCAVDFSFIER